MDDANYVSRGFRGRGRDASRAGRIPPGQYETADFPVLSAGPTPRVDLGAWDFVVDGAVARPARWSWAELQALPHETPVVDIHCVTQWSKLDTRWEGVPVDALLAAAEPRGAYVVAHCDGGYTTNLPLADVTGGRAWIAFGYDGRPLAPEHGGPARLLVPHLYFWKSAKWVRRIEVVATNRPGFWEELGYHDRGDPWREQRYTNDP
jgi:DMSO/TMAO reductase YedYZ molybdopterin-dependent catalytic subunit